MSTPEMADLFPLAEEGKAKEQVVQSRPKLEAQVTELSVESESSTAEGTNDDLLAIGITEYFNLDDRAVFILDLTKPTRQTHVYQNAALQDLERGLNVRKGINDLFEIEVADSRGNDFKIWATSLPQNGFLEPFTYHGVQWSGRTLRRRWRVISGTVRLTVADEPKDQSIAEYLRQKSSFTQPDNARSSSRSWRSQHSSIDGLDDSLAAFKLYREDTMPRLQSPPWQQAHPVETRYESLGPFDFTRPKSSIPLSSHLEFFLGFDWAATELGPMKSWSMELRQMVNILMIDPRPGAMFWGKDRTTMYNEPYALMTGQKHPGMMGKTFVEAWAEVEDDFVPAFNKAYETGCAYNVEDACFYLDRNGYLEESYYTLSIIPFHVNRGEVAFYNTVFDTTRQVVADRRMTFLLRLGQCIAASTEPKEYWQQLLRGLDIENLDLPFALLYSAGGNVNETLSGSLERNQDSRHWVLEGTVKVPESWTSKRRGISTDIHMEEFLPNFHEMVKADTPTLLSIEMGTLPPSMAHDIPVLDGTAACDAAVFLPIRSTGDNVLGFLIMGINPRKRYDDDYRLFIDLLSRQLANSMASALLLEDGMRRARQVAEQADRDRNVLSKKLEIQTQETLEIESRFRRMADLAPVGMFHIDALGVLVYANNDYYTITDHPRNVAYPMSFYSVILEDDHPSMDRKWETLMTGENVCFELRLKREFVAEEVGGEKIKGPTWILAAAYAETDPDGTVVGVLGCITDISRQKWAEDFQIRKMLEAVELKRQQEDFIDMTSHEMRNPLSAIIQCADWVESSIGDLSLVTEDVTISREALAGLADAAQTIILCAQHQKRIIDDILTLSKLDSDLLVITPVEVQPVAVIKTALRMFDGELQKSEIEIHFEIEKSYIDLSVDWVKLDPSRLLQVLINLTTNAIKFTQTESLRKINISIGASLDHPELRNGIEYLSRCSSRKDMSLDSEWGTGEVVYLYIEVQDTGRGLNEEERNLLFKRFSQASPRTHVHYGGSGLGLFISRELTELQGGQIGVASEAGVGSTFAFYVRARRCSAPESAKPGASQDIDMRAQSRVISSQAVSRLQNLPDSSMRPSHQIPAAPLQAKYILIVEDNIVNQKVLSKQLRSVGCVVYVANHGREALSFVESSQFWHDKRSTGQPLSVVLMDLEMPIMDGLTCVQEIRRLQTEGMIVGHIPVIAVTANARSEQIADAKANGMDSVVTKPFRIPELIPELERQLRRGFEKELEHARSATAPPLL